VAGNGIFYRGQIAKKDRKEWMKVLKEVNELKTLTPQATSNFSP
jgi:hypothetical protein